MFTLLRNLRAMFMLTVANYQEAPDGLTTVDTAIQDEKLNLSEIQDLSELPAEMQATILERMEWQLSLAGEIAGELWDITPDSSEGNPTMPEQKTLQFIMNLFLIASDESTLVVDGRIGWGTKRVLKSIMPDYDGWVIDQSRISLLIQMTNSQLSTKISQVHAERQENEVKVSNANTLLSKYSSIEEIKALSVDDRIAAQQALNTLGFDTGGTAGSIGPMSTAAFAEYQANSGNRERQAAAVAAARALEEAAAKVWLNVAAVSERQWELLSEWEYSQLQLAASQAQSTRVSIEEKVRNWYTNDFDLDQDVSGLSLEEAQALFNTAQSNYGRASENGTLAERVQETRYNILSDNDDNYFEAALNLARVQERVANENLEAENTARLAAGLAVEEATDAQNEVTRLQQEELNAYINVLTQWGANTELTSLLESNPEEVRAVIEGMRDMNPEQILALREALVFFGDTGSHLQQNEITWGLVVAVVKMSSDIFADQPGEKLTLDENTSKLITTIHDSYLTKSGQIGELIKAANVRGGLDTGMNALGALLWVSVWYPDAVVVDGAWVRGEINNGLRGRPIIEKTLFRTFQNDYRNVTTHRSTRDHTGETISYDGATTSTPEYWRTRLVDQRLETTRTWFDLSAAGASREWISWEIMSGNMTLELSRSAIDRLYDINPETGALEEESWYTALREYKDGLVDIQEYTDADGEVDYTAYHDAQAEAATDTSVNISAKTLSGAMAEVRRENPERYGEIMDENEANFLALDDISFGLKHAETWDRSEDTYIMWGIDSESGKYTIGIFNAATGEVTQRQEFATKEERMNSDLGQQALTLSSYRYLGVVTTNTEGGLRMADDQGLIRCGPSEKVVLLNDAPPILAEWYNFLRNGLPCGVLGALCKVTVNDSERDRTYTSTEFDPNILPKPEPEPERDRDGWDNDNDGRATETGWSSGWDVDTGWVSEADSGSESTSEGTF